MVMQSLAVIALRKISLSASVAAGGFAIASRSERLSCAVSAG